jgi:hypothetical protein
MSTTVSTAAGANSVTNSTQMCAITSIEARSTAFGGEAKLSMARCVSGRKPASERSGPRPESSSAARVAHQVSATTARLTRPRARSASQAENAKTKMA